MRKMSKKIFKLRFQGKITVLAIYFELADRLAKATD